MTDLVTRAADATRLILRPDTDVAGPADPQPEIRVGLIIAFLFFVIFLGWAACAPLDAGAYASGEVVVSGSRQAVQHREGGVVQPGQTLMEIVPKNAELVIRARVSPDDADDLMVGQKTEIRIPAFHERNLPMLNGVITEISADSFLDEKTGTRFFTADVAVPPSETAKIARVRGAEQGLRPGLPVEVVVPLRKRTALQYFFEPLQQSIWRSFREQ